MDEIKLAEPTAEYADDLWAFRQEILEHDADSDDQFAGCMSLDKCESAEEWIRICSLRKSEETCDEGNVASEKTIIANGGIYENTIDVDGDRMKRYWIVV